MVLLFGKKFRFHFQTGQKLGGTAAGALFRIQNTLINFRPLRAWTLLMSCLLLTRKFDKNFRNYAKQKNVFVQQNTADLDTEKGDRKIFHSRRFIPHVLNSEHSVDWFGEILVFVVFLCLVVTFRSRMQRIVDDAHQRNAAYLAKTKTGNRVNINENK